MQKDPKFPFFEDYDLELKHLVASVSADSI